jgi:hypothetical protein
MPTFDFNSFKKFVKQWIRENPDGTIHELRDYCEELIPPQHFAANQWIVEQTVSWYRHILDHRDMMELREDEDMVE